MHRRDPGTALVEPAEGIYTNLAELIDLRKRIHELPLFSTPQRRSPLLGLHHSRLRGRGVDFDQVRIYQPGDDVRTIDWRVTARTQEPHTKLYHEERERPIYILVEQSQRLFFGSSRQFKSVLAAHAAALIGWATLEHNDRIGGQVFGDGRFLEIKPRRSKHSLLQLLDRLVQANHRLDSGTQPINDTESFAQALRRAREVLRPGSLAVILCDERALSDTAERQLWLLGRHIDLLLLPLSDPLDHALPITGLLRFAQGNARLELDSSDSQLRQAYREQAERRRLRWERLALRLSTPLLPLDTHRDAVEQLHDHLTLHQARSRQ
ncbi:DUF58 domain-containing protein [Azomonas macrocytogenes]|uniref:Uncharacterized protein (DUF58 family) n=1 Tax=Azomonas macrocytogenes TaxID=69962 RepID=A0A839T6N7_AZOMA|nr:DUF58 domain-containing protein [Azomonas macrocytogenes]MBB3104739.1 uncharacterized protein (DUF58 family) [Azomonas macrocytogenes]